MNSFELLAECAPSENGNSHLTRFEFAIEGSAMGQSFHQQETRLLREMVPVEGD